MKTVEEYDPVTGLIHLKFYWDNSDETEDLPTLDEFTNNPLAGKERRAFKKVRRRQ